MIKQLTLDFTAPPLPTRAPTRPQPARVNPALLRDPNPAPKRHRRDDYATSIAGAADIAKRAGGQKRKLLQAYAAVGSDGLNDYEAAEQSGLLRKCFWKRCGELRAFGLIAEVKDAQGATVTRPGDSSVPRIVCAITPLGTDLLNSAHKSE